MNIYKFISVLWYNRKIYLLLSPCDNIRNIELVNAKMRLLLIKSSGNAFFFIEGR